MSRPTVRELLTVAFAIAAVAFYVTFGQQTQAPATPAATLTVAETPIPTPTAAPVPSLALTPAVTPTPEPVPAGALTADEVRADLSEAEWPEPWIPWALCITSHESGWHVDAIGAENHNGSRDYGLWQLNSHWFDGTFDTFDFYILVVHDAVGNSRLAYKIFKVQGPQAWSTRHYCQHWEQDDS